MSCIKVRFDTAEEAGQRADQIRLTHPQVGRLRAYRCDECGWWHLHTDNRSASTERHQRYRILATAWLNKEKGRCPRKFRNR